MAELDFMNAPYVPFTFPTITVQQNAKRALVDLSTSEIDRIWAAYLVATTQKGFPPYAREAGGKNLPLIQELEKATSLRREKIVGWLNATEQTVNQGWTWYWIDPAGAQHADKAVIKDVFGKAGDAVSNFLAPSAEPLTNLVKWTAVAVAGGAVIYGLWTLAPLLGLGKKKRKG